MMYIYIYDQICDGERYICASVILHRIKVFSDERLMSKLGDSLIYVSQFPSDFHAIFTINLRAT